MNATELEMIHQSDAYLIMFYFNVVFAIGGWLNRKH